ncbi:MAG: asparagine synthase [Acidobacteriia bacterium]|nr:asparagine synthase [Terriglobia bacterium]
MIGGYIYSHCDRDMEGRLAHKLGPSQKRIQAWDNGYLFYDEPFRSEQTSCLAADQVILLSEDILVTSAADGKYRRLRLEKDFCETVAKSETEAFNAIQSDCRMAVLCKKDSDKFLYLVSNRAGSGRIYYHKVKSGVIFSSDLRFLLSLVPFDVSYLGIYSLLKYGAIPEPLTINESIAAVPPAHYLKYDVNTGQQAALPFFRFQFAFEHDGDLTGVAEVNLDPVKNALRKSARFLGENQPAMLLSGGIDSSLYGCYLSQASNDRLRAFYCAFGPEDPELQFAKAIAERIGTTLQVAVMQKSDALNILDDVVRLTDHPFSDFSSLPTAFVLKYIREHLTGQDIVVECNGGDDCFGFPDLQNETKYALKHRFPRSLKKVISALLRHSPHWKWESREGALARVAAISDVHELTPLNYFLVLAPVNYLNLETPGEWDETLGDVMESVFADCDGGQAKLGYHARITVRQLLHVNSRRWAAKALSTGQSLGLRIVYPYIWQDILVEQGKLPWNAKVHNGVVKWPLKKLLEEYMPQTFIYRKKSGFVPPFARWLTDRDFNQKVRDIVLNRNGFVTRIVPARVLEELLSDASNGKKLRFPILNFLWGAIFAESWIQEQKRRD